MQNSLEVKFDLEVDFVANLLEAAHVSGLCMNEISFVNLYVSLKAQPMVVITGPEGSGKAAAAHCLSRNLVKDSAQYQVMIGHPWMFNGSKNLALFTEVNMRYNTEKLLSLIEEAWRPENIHRPFIACITHISPTELDAFFTEVAFQRRHGQLMRLGDYHFSEPIPFPPNLFLLGTMDTPVFHGWDQDLLWKTSIVQWPIAGALDYVVDSGNFIPGTDDLFGSFVRDKQAVYCKVHSILNRQKQPLFPLMQIEALLREQAIPNLDWLRDEIMRFLANSWSGIGNGLFHPCPKENLRIALDLAIAQILQPQIVDVLRKNALFRSRLMAILRDQFPRSVGFLATAA